MTHLAMHPRCAHNAPVPAKKAEIGFDSPNERGSGRNDPHRLRPCHLVSPLMVARVGGRKPCRFASAFAGLSTRPGCRPGLTAWSAVVNERLETLMANLVLPLPTAALHPVIQPKRRGRFPRGVASIWRARSARSVRQHAVEDAQKQVSECLRMIEYYKERLATAIMLAERERTP
jgi:hypothetical protein